MTDFSKPGDPITGPMAAVPPAHAQDPRFEYRSNYVAREPAAGHAQTQAVLAQGWEIVNRVQHNDTMDRLDIRRPATGPRTGDRVKSKSDGFGSMLLGAVVIIAVLGGGGFWIGRATSGGGGASASCERAVSEAREGFDLVSKSIEIMGRTMRLTPDAVQAAAARDVDRMNELTIEIRSLTAELQANTAKISASDFQRYASECENG